MPFENRSAAFRTLSQVLNRSFTLREALDGALPRIVELIGAKAGWIFLYDPRSDTFSLAADVNLPPALLAAGRRRMSGDCRCLQRLRDGELTQPVNLVRCLRLEQALDGADGAREHASVPLIARGETVVGILNLLLPDGRQLAARDLDNLEAVGHEVAVAIERARLFDAVRDKEATTRELMRRLLAAHEDERRRIAQDLHDHVGQTMAALTMQLAHLAGRLERAGSGIAADLQRLHEIAQQGAEEIHELVYDLRPMILDDHGLGPAIRSYVESHLMPAGLEASVELIGLGGRLPRDIETAAYRILQEATTNVLRHAGATRLEIRVDRRADQLIVMVRDNGRGFDLHGEPGSQQHLGLRGMRERAELVGGTLQVLPVPGVGTTILARLPLPDPSDRESTAEPAPETLASDRR